MKYLLLAILAMTGCSRVDPGYVGVKVYLLGGSKGVDHEVLGVGRYYIGMNEQLYTFPTFQQNYVWSDSKFEGDGSERTHPEAIDESIEFGAAGGVDVHANVGISFHVDQAHVAEVFQKYREGLTEIRNIPLRNAVRDSFGREGALYSVEDLYSAKKAVLMNAVLADVRTQFAPLGIVVDSLAIVGNFKLPTNVTAALNAKIQATQKAEQAQNEVAESTAEANKLRAAAQGIADSNRIKAASITPTLLEWEKIQKWNGILPTVQGSGTGIMMNMSAGSRQ